MCGIAGVVNLWDGLPPPERTGLLRMVGALGHRGPDEAGLYRSAHAGLGHARLSIIDLSTGQQPFLSDDGTRALVYNGEIFNYLELREELEALGQRFRTKSDTEVLLRAWETWGEQALERLNGQWAFALWDARSRELLLCRDRMGVRPLHVLEHRGRLLFASEIKGLFAYDPEIPREIDPVGLHQTFTFWAPVPPRTVFRGVQEIEPGHLRSCRPSGTRDCSYWAPSFPPRGARDARSIEQATEQVRCELGRATALRMLRADVSVGTYLSGGLDSSLVTALALRSVSERVHTFSIRFEDAEYDEAGFQDAMVRELGTEHHALTIRASDIARVFPDVVRHAERPLLRTAPAPLFLLSRSVRDAGIKVVLTGEGADEVFAGYDLFREGKVRRFWARQPDSELRPLLLERLYPYLARSPVARRGMARHFFGQGLSELDVPGFAHQTRWRTAGSLVRLLSPEFRPHTSVVDELLDTLPAELRGWSHLAQDQYLEMRTLLAGYLLSAQGDRMLMAHSVEGRFPFLDPGVVELAATLGDSHKLKVLDEKHVLKRAAAGLLPSRIVQRKKQPYRAPSARAFVGADVPEWVEWTLGDTALARSGLFQRELVQRLWRKCREQSPGAPPSNSDDMALVAVLSSQLVFEQLLHRPPSSDRLPTPRTDIQG